MSKQPVMIDYGGVTHPFVFASRVGLGRRALAMLVDLAILALPLITCGGSMFFFHSFDSYIRSFVGLSAVIAAYIIFECVFRASLGKMCLRMVVRHANGQRASWSIMLARSVLKLLWVLIPVMIEWVDIADTYILSEHGWSLKEPTNWILPFCLGFGMVCLAAPLLLGIFAAWGSSRQTLYDRLTHTAVYGGELGRDE